MNQIIKRFRNYSKEFKYNLKLAYPVMIGMLGHTFVQFIDNVMVGQLGTAELAAISLGNSFVFIAMSLGIGFSQAITPLIAEADGAKKSKSDWGKKPKSNNTEAKKGKFDWIKNLFGKSGSEKKEDKK